MSIEHFRDKLRDPVLRKAWKMGWKHARVNDIFDGNSLENDIGRSLYRKMSFNNAFLYFINEKEPKTPVLIYLLALPALEAMQPKDIAETFGEAVASLHAEIEAIDTEDDLNAATPLAQEAIQSTYGFFERRIDQANASMAATGTDLEASLRQLEAHMPEQERRRQQWDADTVRLAEIERRTAHLREFTHFDPKTRGLKPN